MENNDFGATLKRLRTSKRMTQPEISEKIGVACCTYRHWESGINLPRGYFIPKIAQALDVPVEVLMEAANMPISEKKTQAISDYAKATQLASELIGLFAGGDLTERDKDAVMFTLHQAYIADKRIPFPDESADIWRVNKDGGID